MKSCPNEEALLAAALGRAAGKERAAYLDDVGRGNPGLRRRLEALLRAVEEAGEFLEQPRQDPGLGTTLVLPITEKAGDRIGRYKLLQQIGEGGCGVIYLAEQEEPIRRRVALKVIKLGMDTKNVIARFEAERQALALMDHPNIAKVLDAGATNTGRPYFVMELVRGVRVTEYCDQHKVGIRQRLNLFVQICHAIQHAHQKGIIHRDIKPSNILVTLHDGTPVPKVIDFGIAKATDQKLTDKTVFTQFNTIIGTPAYMSPEQAELGGLDIDTRSDIYSLGVLLYELLTGVTPFESETLQQSGLDEMRRIIREVEPKRPSTRLSMLELPVAAELVTHRQETLPTLVNLVRGDLDWIVMKALEKDRTRRYETASAFGEDVQRHLANEPVRAVAPSLGYRVGKFVRRNKASLGMSGALALLAGALLVSLHFLLAEWRTGNESGITVSSNPEGAEVWHEGRKLGLTPLTLPGLSPGAFTYMLTLEGYEIVTNTTTVARRRQMNDFTFLRQLVAQPSPVATNLLSSFNSSGAPADQTNELTRMLNLANIGTKVHDANFVPAPFLVTNSLPVFPRIRAVPVVGETGEDASFSASFAGGLSSVRNADAVCLTAPRGATILDMEGQVDIVKKGEFRWAPAQVNVTLSIGDRVRTGPRSRAALRLAETGIVRLGERSELEVAPSRTVRPGQPVLQLEKGQFRYLHDRRGSNAPVEFRTPAATATIRG